MFLIFYFLCFLFVAFRIIRFERWMVTGG